MKVYSIPEEIIKRMKSLPECTIFTVDDLIDLADEETIRMNLCRLVQDHQIVRCINGYFTIPYKMTLIDDYAYPSTQDLAEKIAERYGWTILPVKEAVLNYLGLTTQVPSEIEFISTGPYREFEYRGHKIKFKHTDQLTLLQIPRTNALVIQAIKEIGKNMTSQQFLLLCSYYEKHINEDLSKQTMKIPAWIRRVLRKIEEHIHGKICENKQDRTIPSFS